MSNQAPPSDAATSQGQIVGRSPTRPAALVCRLPATDPCGRGPGSGSKPAPTHDLPLATIARRVVHGIIKRTRFRALRQIEQVVEEYCPVGGNEFVRENAIHCRLAHHFAAAGRNVEKTADHRTDGVLSFSRAKI